MKRVPILSAIVTALFASSTFSNAEDVKWKYFGWERATEDIQSGKYKTPLCVAPTWIESASENEKELFHVRGKENLGFDFPEVPEEAPIVLCVTNIADAVAVNWIAVESEGKAAAIMEIITTTGLVEFDIPSN